MTEIYKIKTKKEYNDLKKRVIEIINDQLDEKSGYDFKLFMKDLNQGGCVSGFISELIYYADTKIFYDSFEDDIEELINESVSNFGSEFLVKLHEGCFKNNASWFAFETIAFNLAYEFLEGDF